MLAKHSIFAKVPFDVVLLYNGVRHVAFLNVHISHVDYKLQSHQVHPNVLTIIQHICSIKQKNKQNKHRYKHKSVHSEMGPVDKTQPRELRTAHHTHL